MGANDANGIYQYDETDTAATFSGFMNKLAVSVSSALGLLKGRVATLETGAQNMGLVKIIPTGANGGTVSADGTVTLAGNAAVVNIGGVLSTFDNVLIVWDITKTTATDLLAVLRSAAGADATGNAYTTQRGFGNGAAASEVNSPNVAQWTLDAAGAAGRSRGRLELFGASAVADTGGIGMAVTRATAGGTVIRSEVGLDHNFAASYSGITFKVASGLMAGKMRFYGYDN